MAKIKTVDFLKGIAVLMVIIGHVELGTTDQQTKQIRILAGFPFYIFLAVGLFMVLSGYVWALSLKRKTALYQKKTIINRLIRFYIPFIFIFILEEVLKFVILHKTYEYPFEDLLRQFLSGGSFPGGYYIPLMLQLILLFPLIFYCINRWKGKGVIIAAIINFNFELFRYLFNLPNNIYRLMIFRYLFAISYGIYLAVRNEERTNKQKRNEIIIDSVMATLGIMFIVCNNYLNIGPFMFLKSWSVDSMLTHLFSVILVKYILKFKNINFIPVNFIGKHSYHIFLSQGLYFMIISSFIYKSVIDPSLRVLISVSVSVGIGLLFYYLDIYFMKCIRYLYLKYKQKKENKENEKTI